MKIIRQKIVPLHHKLERTLATVSAPPWMIGTNLGKRQRYFRDDARAQHFTSIRQELVQNQFKECTFNPNMVALSHSKRLLKKKELRENITKLDSRHEQSPSKKTKHRKIGSVDKRPEGIDLKKIRQLLKEEVTKLELNY